MVVCLLAALDAVDDGRMGACDEAELSDVDDSVLAERTVDDLRAAAVAVAPGVVLVLIDC